MKSQELSILQQKYKKAKIEHQKAEVIEKYAKSKALRENIYMIAQGQANRTEGRKREVARITSPDSDFLMSDADFSDYCQKVHKIALGRGLHKPSADLTCTWDTYSKLKIAENNLLDYVANNVPGARPELTKENIEKIANHWKYRQEVIDLTMQL